MLSFPLGKEVVLPQQAVRQALPFPLGKEAALPRQLLTFLLGKEAISPQQVVRQALSFPLGKEAILPWQLLTFPQVKEAVLPQQVNQTIKLGQSGKVLGGLTGIGQSRLPRRTALSPGKTTSPLPHSRLPQGSPYEDPNPKWVINLSNKPLTPA